MRRNLHTYGMSYKEREAYRLSRKFQIANEKTAKQDTLARFMDTVIAIEDAFKPEADRLFARIVQSWKEARQYVIKNGSTYNAVRTAYTGYDVDANPIPYFTGRQYIGRNYTPEYEEYNQKMESQREANRKFTGTMYDTIITRKLYEAPALIAFAEKQAAEVVEANKIKLLDGVARYLYPYQTVEVKSTDFVKAGVKGFQGEFTLITDKGMRLFTCKAITAEGPIVSFHWRYIIHVKEI